jgi:hypothetical protein
MNIKCAQILGVFSGLRNASCDCLKQRLLAGRIPLCSTTRLDYVAVDSGRYRPSVFLHELTN